MKVNIVLPPFLNIRILCNLFHSLILFSSFFFDNTLLLLDITECYYYYKTNTTILYVCYCVLFYLFQFTPFFRLPHELMRS